MVYREWRRQAGGGKLLAVGPFASLTPPNVNALSDLTLTGGFTRFGTQSAALQPSQYKTITVNGNAFHGGNYCLSLWCDTLYLTNTSTIVCSCAPASYGDTDGSTYFNGGYGSEGALGGGGGGAADNDTTDFMAGGRGADIYNYPTGQPGDGELYLGIGGEQGFTWISGDAWFSGYSWPASGGTGGEGTMPTYPLGTGGRGGGGGMELVYGVGGGGGGGAGLLLIVCRSLTSGGAAQFQSVGGTGGGYNDTLGSGINEEGSGGGGGCIFVYTQKYDGTITADTSGGIGWTNGSAGGQKIFEIGSNGTTLTERVFNQSWDNT